MTGKETFLEDRAAHLDRTPDIFECLRSLQYPERRVEILLPYL